MQRHAHRGSSGIALLAILMAAAGAPAVTCASPAVCPMPKPAADCHSTTAAEGCGLSRVDAAEECCCLEAAKPLAASSSEALAPTLAADVPRPAAPHLDAVTVDRPVPARRRSPCRPAGRALLSLQQTFLI